MVWTLPSYPLSISNGWTDGMVAMVSQWWVKDLIMIKFQHLVCILGAGPWYGQPVHINIYNFHIRGRTTTMKIRKALKRRQKPRVNPERNIIPKKKNNGDMLSPGLRDSFLGYTVLEQVDWYHQYSSIIMSWLGPRIGAWYADYGAWTGNSPFSRCHQPCPFLSHLAPHLF